MQALTAGKPDPMAARFANIQQCHQAPGTPSKDSWEHRSAPGSDHRKLRWDHKHRRRRTNPIRDKRPSWYPNPSRDIRPSHTPSPKADTDSGGHSIRSHSSRYHAIRCHSNCYRAIRCRASYYRPNRCRDRHIRARRHRTRYLQRVRHRRRCLPYGRHPCHRGRHRRPSVPTREWLEELRTRPH